MLNPYQLREAYRTLAKVGDIQISAAIRTSEQQFGYLARPIANSVLGQIVTELVEKARQRE